METVPEVHNPSSVDPTPSGVTPMPPPVQSLSAEERAELMGIFDITIADIDRAKQWNWTITYQTAAALGAILALSRVLVTETTIWPQIALSILALGAGALGYGALSQSLGDLEGYRTRKKRCLALFTLIGQQLMKSSGAPQSEKPETRRERPLPFRGVIVGMTILVIGILALAG